MARSRTKQQKDLPEYVRTAEGREQSMLVKSEATFKKMAARRARPITVPKTVRFFGLHRLSTRELMDLRIDTRYQREEIVNEVNDLIVVLKSGGIIPDPISVADRDYGDRGRYIVDGQQRWWAHVDVGVPLQAVIYKVSSYEDEVALFHALNSSRRVNAGTRLQSWPGPSSAVLHRMAETGPLQGAIHFRGGGSRPDSIQGLTLLRGIIGLLTNTVGSGSIERVAGTFDRSYTQAPKVANLLLDGYARLIADVFIHSRKIARQTPLVAFGKVAHSAWLTQPDKVAERYPTVRQLARLRATNWDKLTPTSGMQWLPTVLAAVLDIWPVSMRSDR